MELSHQSILHRLRNEIIMDIDVHNGIINFLIAKRILKDNDIDQIDLATNKSDKAAALLDILPNRGPHAFKYFQEALEPQYPWLKERMAELEQSNEFITNEADNRPLNRLSDQSSVALPSPSPLTVPRREKTKQLKNALTRLTPNGYVVLHGMKGFGKSWLARNILHDDKEFVEETFGNEIYWLKFGYKGSLGDELLIQLNHLHHLVNNGLCPTDSRKLDEMSLALKQYFLQPNHSRALIVLDDVWHEGIISKFDFACKTLVITTNVDLLGDDRHTELIKMQNGFTQIESLELFSKALDVEINDLPDEARDIHNECKGMPLLIAMFAAQFEEFKNDMAINRDRWKYYLKALRKKDTNNQVIEKFLGKQEIIFDMCIDQLPDEEKKRYMMLVIFDEDVNITPQTLGVLWGEDKYRVEEIMLGLSRKSLAVKQWNDNLKLYIYGIHDLLVRHLRNKIVPAELANQHRKFVEKIYQYCNKDYSKLPLDNYSYSYIGHHLEKAKMFSEFPEIYLNFNFIQAKILNSGVRDLLIDLIKYRDYIINNNPDIEKNVENLEKFLQAHAQILADHRRRKCIDLVQIALNDNKPGFCYDSARSFAKSHQNYLYFCHNKQEHLSDSLISTEVTAELTTVNFTDDLDEILIGDTQGQVRQCNGKSWHPHSGLEKSSIIKVIVSRRGDFFLALNDKSTIKRFLLKEKDNCDSTSDYGDNKLSSPREKQSFWNSMHSEPKDSSVTTYFIEGQRICDMALNTDDSHLVACTAKGRICVWDINGIMISQLDSSDGEIQRVIFTKGNKYIHALNTAGLMTIYKAHNDSYVYQAQIDPLWKIKKNIKHDPRDFKFIYFQEILEHDPQVYSILVTQLRAYLNILIISELGACNPDTRNLFEITNGEFIAATVTHDNRYLVTADTGNFIKIWNIDNPFCPVHSYPARAISLDTYLYDGDHIIISGYKGFTQRKIFSQDSNLPRSTKRPQFDAVMKPVGELDIVAQEIAGNKIGLYQGSELIADFSYMSQIVSLSLNAEANKFLYATNKGDVYLCDIENKLLELVTTLSDCSSFVKFLGIGDTIVCKDKDELLFWYNGHVSRVRANNVVNFHCLRNNYVITISREGTMVIWQKNQTEWQPLNFKNDSRIINDHSGGNITVRNSNICYSSLNPSKNMIALLNVTSEMILHEIAYDDKTVPIKIRQVGAKKHYFNKNLKCCAFSSDGKLIAIGMDNGDISIYDIYNDKHYCQLDLHCNAIRQLHWLPATIGVPILFSVNCDELAAWNIGLVMNEEKEKKRSRTGMTRSTTISFSNSSSTMNLQMSSSQTASASLSSLSQQHDDVHNGNGATSDIEEARKFWLSKTAKDPKFPALLGLISLPLSCNAKLSNSIDCKKFLSVDVYGSINNITLFNSSETNNEC